MRGMKPQVKNPGQIIKRLMGYVFKRYGFWYSVVIILIFVGVLANVQGTLFMKNLIDEYITPFLMTDNPDFAPLARAIGRVAVFYAVGVVSVYAYNRIMVNITQGTQRELRNELFAHMQKLPVKYFDTHAHGDIMSIYTNDIDTLRQMISQSIPNMFSSAVTLVSVFLSMLVLSWQLTLLLVAMLFLMTRATQFIGSRSGRYFVEQQEKLGKVNGYIEEMINGQKVVKVFCHENENIERFRAINQELQESTKNANKIANILMPVNGNLGNISYVLCAVLGAVLALNGMGSLTLGTLVSYLNLNRNFTQPVTKVSQQFNSIIMALAGAERVFQLLDEQPEPDGGHVQLVNAKKRPDGSLMIVGVRTGLWAWRQPRQDGSVTLTELEGGIAFDDVDFGYSDEKIVLHNIKLFATP